MTGDSVPRPVTATDFDSLVLARSATVPVVCDFWAAWCNPCRMIAPLLEELAASYAGRADIVKVDTDAEPALAARYGIRSLPTVAVFRHGELAESLVGAHPAGTYAALIERHLERPADRERAAALASAAAGDADGAIATLERLVAAEPDRRAHWFALVDVLIDAGRLDAAATLLADTPISLEGDPAVAALRARLELASAAAERTPAGERRAAAARDFLRGHHAEAVDALLALMRDDRKAGAAQLLRATFVLLGDHHELAATARRRMAALMH